MTHETALRPTHTELEVRTLQERAQRLARLPQATERDAQTEVLVFRLGDEHYAIALRLLRLIQRATGLTPVPCTPAYIAGMLNVRGDVLTVIDLQAALGVPGPTTPPEHGQVLLAEVGRVRVGLRVDEVLGIRGFALEHLDPPLGSKDYAQGIAEASIVVLDLERILAADRFAVGEEYN